MELSKCECGLTIDVFQGDDRIVTASGDKKLAIWDTRNAQLIRLCRGHSGSVRTVCASQRTPGMFASGRARPSA